MEKLNDNIIRPVSVYEQNLQIYGNVLSRNILKGKISPDAFKQALLVMTQRHILLNCVFYKHGQSVYFMRKKQPVLPLTIHYNLKEQQEIVALYKQELNHILNPYEGLWRVLLIFDCKADEINKESTIQMILTVHHSICDANSLLNLVKEILEQTQAIQKQQKLYEGQILPVASPLESYLEQYLSEQNPEPETDNEKSLQDNYRNIYKWNLDFSVPEEKSTINFCEDSLSNEETTTLIHKCREQETTVHGILCACMVKALIELLGDELKDNAEILFYSPFDPRKKIPSAPGKTQLVCFTTGEEIICPTENNASLVQLAGEIMRQLNEKISRHERFKALLKRSSTDEVITKVNKAENKTLFIISNIGRLDFSHHFDDFLLIKTNFTASNKLPFLGVEILTFNNSLNYIIPYTEPWFTTEYINGINHRFKKWIFNFLNNETKE